jgi:hypothetical protein
LRSLLVGSLIDTKRAPQLRKVAVIPFTLVSVTAFN